MLLECLACAGEDVISHGTADALVAQRCQVSLRRTSRVVRRVPREQPRGVAVGGARCMGCRSASGSGVGGVRVRAAAFALYIECVTNPPARRRSAHLRDSTLRKNYMYCVYDMKISVRLGFLKFERYL